MSVSEAKRRAIAKYDAKTYYTRGIKFKQDFYKQLEEYAGQRGESVNGLVIRACVELLERDKQNA